MQIEITKNEIHTPNPLMSDTCRDKKFAENEKFENSSTHSFYIVVYHIWVYSIRFLYWIFSRETRLITWNENEVGDVWDPKFMI